MYHPALAQSIIDGWDRFFSSQTSHHKGLIC